MSRRFRIVLFLVLVIVIGLLTRRFHSRLPAFLGEYAPDAMWALAVFLLTRLLLPRASTPHCATIAVVFAVAIEVCQLYHAPWIDSLRRTALGGLVLGYGFLWSDIACYLAGVGIGAGLDMTVLRPKQAAV